MDLTELLNVVKLLFGRGLVFTFKLSGAAILTSSTLGLIGGVIRSKRIPVLDWILGLFSGITRGTPFLVLVLLVYYATPIRNPFLAGVISLTISHAVYVMEIICGGIGSIRREQYYAATALGLSFWQRMRYVILPQVLLFVTPAIAGQMIILVKDTALTSAIGYLEITRMGRNIMQVYGSPYIIFGFVLVGYFIVCHLVKMISDQIENWLRHSIVAE